MQTAISIEIDAPPDVVFRLARDVTRWDRLLPHYVRSRAIESTSDAVTVDFIARHAIRQKRP